ncbi:MAG: ATP-binding cassette domain-containing protein [Yaniella sp.]|uniref:ATP-binding cassette domain-containing protein n=1 Tax=Yaniella sp. TaxID=2773929 RepID=UPI003F9CDC28
MPDHSHANFVQIVDAKLHNLKNISVQFPRGAVVAFTGVSGSGKSSLAFGTIHGEAQRRYLESVAPFARRLIGSAVDPQVEIVDGMPPTVALEQRTSAGGARSDVGTITALSNSIRLLFSRAGVHPDEILDDAHGIAGGRLTAGHFSPYTAEGMCPDCQGVGKQFDPAEELMVPDPNMSILDGAIAAWPGAWLGKNFREILETVGVDTTAPWHSLDKTTRDWILYTDETPVITVVPIREAWRTQGPYEGQWESVARYLRRTVATTKSDTNRARALSFFTSRTCPTCDGHRLNAAALQVRYLDSSIWQLTHRSLASLLEVLQNRHRALAESDARDDGPVLGAERILLPAAISVLDAVNGLGLGHLSMDRAANTLSTGELQRLRLASQVREGLFGVAYVLDEPSAGLHPAEKHMLSKLFERFIAEGNSVLLVEHDMSLVAKADWIIDVGPKAGISGGRVIYSGPIYGLADVEESITARFVNAPPLQLKDTPSREATGKLQLEGVNARTIEDLDVDFPLGQLTAVSGVSGSGKSTLVTHVLGTIVGNSVSTTVSDEPTNDDAADADDVKVRAVTGLEHIQRLVHITQRPIGRTPRSVVATYTGLFDRVRRIFAATDEAKQRGWGIGRFSFNVTDGRCPECSGLGQIEVELIFLPGSYATCPVCHGQRFKSEILEVTWNGHTVADILDLSVHEAKHVFAEEATILRALEALDAIGLGYITLGQRATELSGGEAQRIKLATELQRITTKHTLYLLDEPSSGLHPADVALLNAQLHRLVDHGHTVIVVEHDQSVIATADHVIDMGPGAGESGGQVIAAVTPAELGQDQNSTTGRYLALESDVTRGH